MSPRSSDAFHAQQAAQFSGLPPLDGSFVTDEAALRAAARDAGGMIVRQPRGVLRPGSVDDIVKIVRYANERQIPIVMRGRGHSRYGQSLVDGGIAIDSRTLDAVGRVSNHTIDVQAGASLERALLAALDQGFAFPVMTSCVMLSVGGFLSVGGQTRGGQRYGAFVDQVAELDVVTGDGRLVTCSETRERELFDMILAGMGHCGIIVGARLNVIPAPERAVSRTLTYTSFDKFLADQRLIAAETRFDVIEGALERGDGPFDSSERGAAQGRNWIHQMTVANLGTTTANLDPAPQLRDLSPDAISEATVLPYRSFASTIRPGAAWKPPSVPPSSPPPTRRVVASPSVALWVPASAAREILMTVAPPPSDAGIQGTECTVLNTERFRRPLFRVPDAPQMVALWFLRAVFADQVPTLEEQLSANARLIDRARALGATRYPPYSDLKSASDWEDHYGETLYRRVVAAKRRFDPRQILASGARM
jgi:FAD/FMN-containing dehydrogenase